MGQTPCPAIKPAKPAGQATHQGWLRSQVTCTWKARFVGAARSTAIPRGGWWNPLCFQALRSGAWRTVSNNICLFGRRVLPQRRVNLGYSGRERACCLAARRVRRVKPFLILRALPARFRNTRLPVLVRASNSSPLFIFSRWPIMAAPLLTTGSLLARLRSRHKMQTDTFPNDDSIWVECE